jgi:immune inhibitor A
MMAYNYIIQGEDCAIGTFTHEFAHDLGLPDEYDTQYTAGGEPVEFWSLMSSGSWLGKPLDIEPSSISPWGRMVLGQIWGGNWVKPVNVDLASLTSKGTTYNIDQAVSYGSNNQAIKVNLPDQKKILAAQPVSGSYYCYSGKGDDMDNTMTISAALPSVGDLKLNFKLWFNTESLWDFGFVRVSADNGTTWTSLSSAMTTSNHDPEADASIVANLPGYTGNSNGWVNESLDLSSYAGKNILLRFEYMTDAAMSYDGLFIDDISIMAGTSTVLSEGFENGIGSFNNNGWALSSGEEYKGHYYMLEWRNFTKTDETLKNCYNFTDYNKGIAEYYSYEPGLVLWYRNMMYDDNWVGLHPGYAFLGVVDSHPNPLMFSASTALRPRLQLSDAVFNIKAVPSKYVTIKGKKVQIGNKPAAPVFDDSNTYYYPQAYDSGLKLVNYGFKFQVTGTSTDGTVGSVTLYKK